MFKASPIRPYIELLSSYLKPLRSRMWALAVLLLGAIGLQLAGPQAVRYFIDTAQTGGDLSALYAAAALFLVFNLASRALGALTTYLGNDVAWRATNSMRSDLLLHILNLDMSFHTEHTPGELVERVDGDIDRLSNFLSQFVVRLAASLLLTAGVLVLLLLDDWRIALAVAGFVFLDLFVHTYGQMLTTPHWKLHFKTRADVSGFVGEHYPALKDIQKSGAEGYAAGRFHKLIGEWRRTYLWAHMTSSGAWQMSLGVLELGNVVAMWIGAYLSLSGSVTIGTVYLVFHYLRLVKFPLLDISAEIQNLPQARAAVQRIRELFDVGPTLPDTDDARSPGELSVEFKGVSFSYLPERSVLKDLSFELRPGRVLGVLGRTGSGKTTLSRLVFRLYDRDRGVVQLGGVDVREIRLDELRRRVGMVTQDAQLFNASVRDNLTLFDNSIDDGRIVRCLDDLGQEPWLRLLPEGLDTVLTAGGEQLSAGEGQLVAFARVFLRDPDLVILDEASSRLDPATESVVERAVDSLLEGRTAIIIAHRLATLERVDDILIIDDGRVVEHGSREALAAAETSRYSGLLRTGMEEVLS